jgi:hypothetical protein
VEVQFRNEYDLYRNHGRIRRSHLALGADWQVRHGTEINPDGLFAGRQDYGEVVFEQCLRGSFLPNFTRGQIRVKDVERFLGGGSYERDENVF